MQGNPLVVRQSAHTKGGFDMPRDATIVAAMDADATGGELADNIRQAVELTGRDDLVYVIHQPDGFKDWNDQLRKRPKRSLSSQPQVPSVA